MRRSSHPWRAERRGPMKRSYPWRWREKRSVAESRKSSLLRKRVQHLPHLEAIADQHEARRQHLRVSRKGARQAQKARKGKRNDDVAVAQAMHHELGEVLKKSMHEQAEATRAVMEAAAAEAREERVHQMALPLAQTLTPGYCQQYMMEIGEHLPNEDRWHAALQQVEWSLLRSGHMMFSHFHCISKRIYLSSLLASTYI